MATLDIEFRAVIQFLTKGVKPGNTKQLDAVNGNSSQLISTVKFWFKLFHWERESLEGDLLQDGLVTITIPENIPLACKLF